MFKRMKVASGTDLPPGAAVAVPLVLEVGHVLDHPLVDLGEGEALFRGARDGLRDEVGVTEVAPGISPRRVLLDRQQARGLAHLTLLGRGRGLNLDVRGIDVAIGPWQGPRVGARPSLRLEAALQVEWHLVLVSGGSSRIRHRLHHHSSTSSALSQFHLEAIFQHRLLPLLLQERMSLFNLNLFVFGQGKEYVFQLCIYRKGVYQFGSQP